MSKKQSSRNQQKPVNQQKAVNPPPPAAREAKEMDGNNSVFHKIIWFAMLGFLAIIFIKVLKDDPLAKEDEESGFSAESYIDRSYQEAAEAKLLAKPFISGFKKQKNEWDYEYFRKVNLDDSYTGKENYVFGELMTQAYFGDDYQGDELIKDQVRKAKFVQEKLKELGITLLIGFAPGKSSIYTEYLPDAVRNTKKKISNYEAYIKECRKNAVNTLDYVQYFKNIKPTSKYPLFPKYGSHWSYYAECLVVDTTIKHLEKLMGVNLPNIVYKDIQMLDTTKARDADIFGKAGLKVPKGDLLAYPQSVGYENDGNVKPEKVLGIGDSYFRGFFYLGAMKYAFGDSKQWYYYNSIIPESADNPEVWELDLKTELLKHKAILILCNESNLKNLGNGFIDDAYDLFSNPQKYYAKKKEKDKVNKFKKQIRNDGAMLLKLTKDAQHKGITLDSLIWETAEKMNRDLLKKK